MKKKNRRFRIEIIATDGERVYSVGEIKLSPEGDVYVRHRVYMNNGKESDIHFSRHKDGKTYISSEKNKVLAKRMKNPIRTGVPIKEFKGLEHLQTWATGIKSLPYLYEDYQPSSEADGIFCVDMRQYGHGNFNMGLFILSEEGLPMIHKVWSEWSKRQIYIYPDSFPMVGIIVCEVGKKKESAQNRS